MGINIGRGLWGPILQAIYHSTYPAILSSQTQFNVLKMPKLFPLHYSAFISLYCCLKGIYILLCVKYQQIGVTGTAKFFTPQRKLICTTLREILTIFHIYGLLLTVLIQQGIFQLIRFQNKEILTEVLSSVFFMLSNCENYAFS